MCATFYGLWKQQLEINYFVILICLKHNIKTVNITENTIPRKVDTGL